MVNLKYKWAFNNNYNTKQLESVSVKGAKTKMIKRHGISSNANAVSPGIFFLINGPSIGDTKGNPWSTMGGGRYILGDKNIGNYSGNTIGQYIRFNLEQKLDFSFDIDLSKSAGGTIASFYFVPMGELGTDVSGIPISLETAKQIQNNYNKKDFEYKLQGQPHGSGIIIPNTNIDDYWESSRALWHLRVPDNSPKSKNIDAIKKTITTNRSVYELMGFGYNDAQSYGDGFGTIEIDCFQATSMGAQSTLHFDVSNNPTESFSIGYAGRDQYNGTLQCDAGGCIAYTSNVNVKDNSVTPFAVNLDGSGNISNDSPDYIDMHGVYANVHGSYNTPSDPVGKTDPSSDSLLYQYGPQGTKIDTNKAFNCRVITSYDKSTSTFKMCTVLTQTSDDGNELRTLILGPENNKSRVATIYNSKLKAQLKKMCFIISYHQTSPKSMTNPETSWWLDGVKNNDIRGAMLNTKQQLSPEVKTKIDAYQTKLHLKPSQKDYHYSATAQNYINTGEKENIKKFCPSIFGLANLIFKECTLMETMKIPDTILILDSMFRGIDSSYDNGNSGDAHHTSVDNFHGAYMGSYGLFGGDFPLYNQGSPQDNFNVNKEETPEDSNSGKQFTNLINKSGPAGKDGYHPPDAFRLFIKPSPQYIGDWEKNIDLYAPEYANWTKSTMFDDDGVFQPKLSYADPGTPPDLVIQFNKIK